jgi:prophage DNA circulation protein
MVNDNSRNNFNGQIKEVSLNGIPFPVEAVEIRGSHDLVQHKKPNVNGAKVEGTGRNPYTFHVKAIFLNGVTRANGESWNKLFPETYNQVFFQLSLNDAIDFVHPTMGTFRVKPVAFQSTTSSQIRNGQLLDFDLLEVNAAESDNIIFLSSINNAQAACSAMDKIFKNPPAGLTNPGINFYDTLHQIQRAFDQTSLFIQKANGLITNFIYRLNLVAQSAARLKSTSTAIIQQNINRIKDGLYTLQRIGKSTQTLLSSYTVPVRMTLGNIVMTIGANLEDVIKLNPDAAKSTIVRAGTRILYPTPKQ